MILALISCSSTKSISSEKKKFTKAQLKDKLFKIPGEWKYMGLDQNSGQHFFEGKMGATGLSYNEKNQYDFFKPEQNQIQQLTEYYNWESDFMRKQGQISELIEQDEEGKFII